MRGFIYCYTNKLTGMKYVGQTVKTLKERAGNNGKAYHYKFGNAIREYGWENFIPEILEEISADNKIDLHIKLNERETYWIDKLDTYLNGYNITRGGNASDGWTDEMKKKLANTNRGHKVSESTRQKISNANTGRKNTDQQLANISIGVKAGIKKFKEERPAEYTEYRERIRSALLNRTFTDEWKQKLRDSAKKRKILCVELNIVFNSLIDANKYFNKNAKNGGVVKRAAERSGTAYGYHWLFID